MAGPPPELPSKMSILRFSTVVLLTGDIAPAKDEVNAMKSRTLNLIAVIAIAITAIASSRTQTSAIHYIYVLKAKNPAVAQKGPRPEDAPLVQAHVKYLRGLIEKGVCVVAGHTLNQDESGFGIVVVKTDSSMAAQEIMEHDPLVQAGILEGNVFPFDIAIAPSAVNH